MRPRNDSPAPSLHPEDAEARTVLDRRFETGGEGEAQHVAGLDRVDHAVVPQARGGVVGIALVLVFLADGGLEFLRLFLGPPPPPVPVLASGPPTA